jgi:septum formation protein
VRATIVDESVASGELPEAYVARVVDAKLDEALRDLAVRGEVARFGAVLAADTAVVLEGDVLGKPLDDAHAARMLSALSGREHVVATCFAVSAPDGSGRRAQTVVTRVAFRALQEDEIERYVATGEGRDKAGGYAIQGIGAFAVARIAGSYSNVVGLPQCEVITALLEEQLLPRFPLDGTRAGSG